MVGRALYAAVPTGDGSAVEPDVPVDAIVFDRDGFPWTRAEDGWLAAGDWRCQSWADIRKWF